MRRPFIAGNWKMHKTAAETERLASELVRSCAEVRDADIAIAPPFTALSRAASALAGSPIALAAQNMHWEEKGAFTGEVSPVMLSDLECRYVILGHSERRQLFGETDENVNRKVRSALSHGLTPILCVGETEEERDRGVTFVVVDRQLSAALRGVAASQIPGLVVAYEPVWAIGTGRTATPEQAQEVHREIRARAGNLFDAEAARSLRILYGGSVKPDNIDALMAETDIDGALVGGASLDAASFTPNLSIRAEEISIMTIVLTILHVLVSLFLILVVLAQQGKGQDLASAFGGSGSATTFGARGTATLLHKVTAISAVLFMLTSLGLTYFRTGGAQRTVVPDTAPAQTRPAPEAPQTPTTVPESGEETPEAESAAPDAEGKAPEAEGKAPEPESKAPEPKSKQDDSQPQEPR